MQCLQQRCVVTPDLLHVVPGWQEYEGYVPFLPHALRHIVSEAIQGNIQFAVYHSLKSFIGTQRGKLPDLLAAIAREYPLQAGLFGELARFSQQVDVTLPPFPDTHFEQIDKNVAQPLPGKRPSPGKRPPL